jgi:hypothetical protein
VFIIGIDPHKASPPRRTPFSRAARRRDPSSRRSFAAGSPVEVRGALRAALLGDRGRDGHRDVASPTTRRRRRDRAGCAAEAVGSGPGARQRTQRQDRRDPSSQQHPWPRQLPAQTDRGKHIQEAMRALKRRISDAVYRRLRPTQHAEQTGPEGQAGTTLQSSVAG